MTPAPTGRPTEADRVRRWLPAAAWAAALLAATSWPNPSLPDEVRRGDKLAHFALYAVLGFLLARAAPAARRALPALALVVAISAFGALDEWHQRFVPGRAASVDDWVADTLGGACGLFAARARRRVQPA